MAKSNLLKEAIADAKAVRETAIENAKLALQEAFTPAVKSLLSKKIQMEMEDDIPDEELEDEEETVEEENPELAVEPEEGEEEAEEEEVEEESVEEKVVDEEEVVDDDDEEEVDEDLEEEEVVDDDEEEDLDLEAILKELEDDEEEEVTEPEFEDEEKVEEEDIDLDIEDDEDEEEIEEEDIDLEKVLSALSEDDEEDDEEEKEDAIEFEQLKKENENYRRTLEYLRSKLNEINLLNAKLLFTNKVFKKQTLSNNQKLAVVEQFDRAHNLREIKLVYTTLVETFTGTKVQIKKTKGSASKVTASTKSKKSVEVLVEGAGLRDRFKKLANLKK